MKRFTFLLALAMLFIPGFATAKLGMGDPAPKLEVGEWIQGEPVKALEPGTIYVMEFWATWCGPCIANIPHVNELSEKYPEVVFIGANVWERDESKVAPLVEKMKETLTYRVALDDKSKNPQGAMATNWMTAAGENGIPSTFIVDKQGKIAWIGHPAVIDEPLAAVVAGTYDIEAERAKMAAEEKFMAELTETVLIPANSGKFAEALAGLEKLDAPADQQATLLRIKGLLLLESGDKEAAYLALDEMIAAGGADQANQLAWEVLTSKRFEGKRDVDRALAWSKKSIEAEKHRNNPVFLDTLARAHAMKGDFAQAADWQYKAVANAEGSNQAAMQEVLDAYRESRLPE